MSDDLVIVLSVLLLITSNLAAVSVACATYYKTKFESVSGDRPADY